MFQKIYFSFLIVFSFHAEFANAEDFEPSPTPSVICYTKSDYLIEQFQFNKTCPKKDSSVMKKPTASDEELKQNQYKSPLLPNLEKLKNEYTCSFETNTRQNLPEFFKATPPKQNELDELARDSFQPSIIRGSNKDKNDKVTPNRWYFYVSEFLRDSMGHLGANNATFEFKTTGSQCQLDKIKVVFHDDDTTGAHRDESGKEVELSKDFCESYVAVINNKGHTLTKEKESAFTSQIKGRSQFYRYCEIANHLGLWSSTDLTRDRVSWNRLTSTEKLLEVLRRLKIPFISGERIDLKTHPSKGRN